MDKSIYTDTMKENNTYHERTEGPNLPESFCVNPFSVPENYFEKTEDQIISQIEIENRADSKGKSFIVPNGYFDQLQATILAQTSIDISSGDEAMFTVPEGYFGELSSSIKNRIVAEDLQAKIGDAGFTVPEGYFEQSSAQIQRVVALDGLQAEDGGFTVDQGYFDTLSAKIARRISEEDPPVKETPIRRIGVNRWIKYASAACIVAVLSLGTYFGLNSNPTQELYAVEEVALGEISDEELMDYLSMNGDSDDLFYFVEYMDAMELTDEISIDLEDDDLEEYLNYIL